MAPLKRLNLLLLLTSALPLAAAQVWTVRIEEPTGIHRRESEIARIPLTRLGGNSNGFTVLSPEGRELPWQVSGPDLLFPVGVVPGELPEYRVVCCTGTAPRFTPQVEILRKGMTHLELSNSRFRVVIDTRAGAIVEAYSLTAGPQRMLNLVETTPESSSHLSGDIHEDEKRAAFAPVPGVEGDNSGWTTLGGQGEFTAVEILESGPLQGHVRLTRAGNDAWDLTWTASGAWLRWKAATGFRFAAVSAAPFMPFNRFADQPGSVLWPDAGGTGDPDPHDVSPRPYRKLPAGHAVYYQRAENYGALGLVALDEALDWTGVGSRRFLARKPSGEAEIAITFPRWRGGLTLLEARRENAILRQPVLVRVSAPAEGNPPAAAAPAAREQAYKVEVNAPPVAPFREDSISLNGAWELAFCDKGCDPPASGYRTVQVPGSVHLQWLGPDKAMTREAEWVSYKEWWYRRKIRLPERYAGKRLRLHFEATDYYAETFIDGRFIGRHEGYIDPYEFDVTERLEPGAEHEIMVRVWTPVSYYWRHRPYTVKGSYGAVDQKPDDITALGITRPVRIIASASNVIADVAVDTRLTANNGAEVEVHLTGDGGEPGYSWELTLSPRNFQSDERYRVTAPAGRADARFVIPVKNPQLWWTWDHGKPNLYTLDVRLIGPSGEVADARSLAVGIREIEKIGWRFYLNRKRMFIRGTNYYYNLFMSEMDRAKYQRDLELMLKMNVNMIRLHCHFSNPEFYDLADERGVLIWQDYLEAWYPEDTRFSLHAAALYDNHIRYVRNHPSIAIWATSDEESLENYRDLTKHLAPRASMLDPQRRAVVRSTGRYGDSHVYHGWYGGTIWNYTKMNDLFVSELGATSLPNYETIITFLPDHWPIRDHKDEWIWRKLQIPEAMRAWGDPGDMSLKEYIPQTQAYTSRLFQIALERVRRRKAEGTGGILHFHAIDIWPSITMAAIDYARRPTKVFDTVRRSFEPVAASIEYDRDKWKSGEELSAGIWAINDRWEPVSGARIHWQIVDAKGVVKANGAFPAGMAADSSEKVGEVKWTAAEAGKYELRAEVRDGGGKAVSENIFEFEVTK